MISLQQVGKKYQNSRKQIETKSQKIRQKLENAIQSQTIKALKIQNYKVSEIHKNQQAIQQKIRKNYQMTNQIRRSITNWTLIYESLNNSLKKAGDLAHYADYVQQQIQETNQILFINKQKNSMKNKANLQMLQHELNQDKQINQQKDINQVIAKNNTQNIQRINEKKMQKTIEQQKKQIMEEKQNQAINEIKIQIVEEQLKQKIEQQSIKIINQKQIQVIEQQQNQKKKEKQIQYQQEKEYQKKKEMQIQRAEVKCSIVNTNQERLLNEEQKDC